jgi:hypothetical protein
MYRSIFIITFLILARQHCVCVWGVGGCYNKLLKYIERDNVEVNPFVDDKTGFF